MLILPTINLIRKSDNKLLPEYYKFSTNNNLPSIKMKKIKSNTSFKFIKILFFTSYEIKGVLKLHPIIGIYITHNNNFLLSFL